MSSPPVSEAILIFVVGELVYLSYKVGRLEARVSELKRKVEDLYTLLDEKHGEG
ncbi:MAG: hypothetical protein QXU69_07725 [Thermofilaceae archaeon]